MLLVTSRLFLDVSRRGLVVTDVSWTAGSFNMGQARCPETPITTNLHGAKSQKSEYPSGNSACA